MKKISLLFLLFAISACQTVQPIKHTASGFPEIKLAVSQNEASGMIAEKCMDAGLVIFDQNNHQVICGKQMTGMEAGMAQFLIGNSYSTIPDHKVRFSIAKVNEGTRIMAYQWIETQMAFGQMRKQPLTGGEQFNSIQNMLNSINAPTLRTSNTEGPVFISSVIANSLADKKGLTLGSMIAEVNQTKVMNVSSLHKILSENNDEVLWLIWENGKAKFYALPASLEEIGIVVKNGK